MNKFELTREVYFLKVINEIKSYGFFVNSNVLTRTITVYDNYDKLKSLMKQLDNWLKYHNGMLDNWFSVGLVMSINQSKHGVRLVINKG